MKKLGLLLFFALPVCALAQTINATLGGTVSDASGALIPGVAITATNLSTGIVTTSLTNEAGAYNFASIQSGNYKVSAELAGFQTQTYNNVNLGVSQQVRLNFTLQVGAVAQSVEVNVAADNLIATSSSSVGSVLPDSKIKDLPLIDRNVLGLVSTQPGVQMGGMAGGDLQAPAIFAGTRGTNVNTSRDGVSVNDTRHNDSGGFAITYTSPDLVEEVRVIVAAADAELGRGGGQVQMATRAGTNQFRGSVFYTNRNSALDASNWFNNFNAVPKNYYNRNQFGGRIGGPIIKNKTFFFGLYDGQRFIARDTVVGNVLTADARQGIFRFFPGVQSANATSNNPAVDLQGNPVPPRGATGSLSTIPVLTTDTIRRTYDPSGWVQMAISRMPLPNDFTVGDGLNTAGIRWTRRRRELDDVTGSAPNINRDQFNLRLDHNFNANNKLFFTGTREWDISDTQIAPWPGGYGGVIKRRPMIFTVSAVSALSPTIVNEFRFGYRKQILISQSGFERQDGTGPEAFKTLPVRNGITFIPKPIEFTENFIFGGFNGTRGNEAPRWSFNDSINWTHGHHAFKAGGELGITTAQGYTNQQVYPYAEFGAGGVPITGINETAFPGLQGADQTAARNLLADLSGSVNDIIEAFVISGPVNPQFLDVSKAGSTPAVPSAEKMFLRDWRQNDFSAFFKDDWKVTPNITLNVGLRYDWYGVAYDNFGLLAAPVGGSKGLFGISGTDFSAQWRPGASGGSPTTLQLVGKNSPLPDQTLWKNDYNNFGPAIGVSWSLPWWGKDKTVFRAGYGVNYNGIYDISMLHNNQFATPGTGTIPTYTQSGYLSLTNLTLPIPLSSKPLEPVPVTDRSQSWSGYDSNYVTPYIQSFNVSLTRDLTPSLNVEARYIGSKGTKLYGGIPLNNVNIFENGILDAFNVTRAGSDAPLFNQLLNGLSINTGQVVNGGSVTGSMALRQNTTTRAFLANGNVGALADFINRTPVGTNTNGGLLRNANLPENFIVVNPQFRQVNMITNAGNSTYHSMVLVLNRRFANGFTNQTSFTWSKNLGEQDEETTVQYMNPRNRSLNKQLLGYDRRWDLRSNGLWQLPFGPGRKLLGNAPAIVSRLVERWQLGAIFSLSAGAPLTITAPVSTIIEPTNNVVNNTPVIVGDFPKSTGHVTKVSNGVVYFAGFGQVTDPAVNGVTTAQQLQGQFSNKAITDASGRILLVNPQPGQLGTMGLKWITGPGNLGLDMNLTKRVKLTETKEFELRIDATNILNHPNFGAPVAANLSISSVSFGRITTASGGRSFVINSRLNF
jgi:hypothetical protein